MFSRDPDPTLFSLRPSAAASGAFVPNRPPPARDAAASRRTDPETSRKAAERIAPFASGHAAMILAVVRRRPGLTAVEIAAEIRELDRYQVSRRLPQLEKAGQVRKGRARPCRVKGSDMMTWLAISHEPKGGKDDE